MGKTWSVFAVLLIAGLSLHSQDATSKPAESAVASTDSPENSVAPQSSTEQNSKEINPPEILSMILPKYPKEARRAKIRGSVVLNAVIGKDGSVQNIKVTCGHPLLVNAAIDAVRQWRYKPALRKNEPAEVPTTFTVKFPPGNKEIPDCSHPSGPPVAASADISTKSSEDEVFKVRNGVTPPRPIYSPDPEYTDKARRAKLQGTVRLSFIVTTQGEARDIKVERSLGLGLDEKAIETARQWRFTPATKDGEPVETQIHVEFTFHLYR